MRLIDYFTGALEDISSAKLRSFLTSLGIIIGVGSVVLMLSVGAGFESTVTDAFADLGSTRIIVNPGRPGGGTVGGAMMASTLTVADAEAISGVDAVDIAAPVLLVPAKVSTSVKTMDLALTGTTPGYSEATGQELIAGRVFGADTTEAVLNEAAVEQLVGQGEAVGTTVTVNAQEFTIVGVFKNETPPFAQLPSGRDAGEETVQPAVFVPVERALELAETENVARIVAIADSPETVDAAIEGIDAVLLERHDGVDDFRVTSLRELMESFTDIFDVLTAFLAAIAGISLLVGGIGIMNIMLASVTERTREIGIAKAIGATRGNVVAQFLTESVLISLLGGMLGLALAWFGTVVLKRTLDLPAIVSPAVILLAVGVSAAIGIFFGVVPAWRAARLDPIVALRHE